MSITRAEDKKKESSRKYGLGTLAIQKQFEAKHNNSSPQQIQVQTQIPKFIVEVDDDIGYEDLIKTRHADIQKLGEDMQVVYGMSKDLAGLIEEQQPGIDNLQKTLESVHAHTEQAEKELVEAEKRGGWCVIL